MKQLVLPILIFFAFSEVSSIGDPERSDLVPEGMITARVVFFPTDYQPVAALVLVPGMNGDSSLMLKEYAWQKFAAKHKLALVGVNFESDVTVLYQGKGYTSPDLGSGELLISSIDNQYGRKLPLLLYGFSSGGLFVKKFVILWPHEVKGWAAHAVGWYSESVVWTPPGLISCGVHDFNRLGPALTHFQKTRLGSSRNLWLEARGLSHERSARLERFIRSYFDALLTPQIKPLWVDITNRRTLTDTEADHEPNLSGWLPDERLKPEWAELW